MFVVGGRDEVDTFIWGQVNQLAYCFAPFFCLLCLRKRFYNRYSNNQNDYRNTNNKKFLYV